MENTNGSRHEKSREKSKPAMVVRANPSRH